MAHGLKQHPCIGVMLNDRYGKHTLGNTAGMQKATSARSTTKARRKVMRTMQRMRRKTSTQKKKVRRQRVSKNKNHR